MQIRLLTQQADPLLPRAAEFLQARDDPQASEPPASLDGCRSHVFRAAIIARRAGVNGQVTGARTAGYYWPSAMLREFAAVFLSYKVINFGICALIVALPLAYAGFQGII